MWADCRVKWTGREGAAAGCTADARASASGWAPANRSRRGIARLAQERLLSPTARRGRPGA
ncbi:hypothetical protein AB691_3510 [Stutzerimonas stutzeri]|nr:hypothetical protein AB691_3510 [Stutzerimonas stutzeri]